MGNVLIYSHLCRRTQSTATVFQVGRSLRCFLALTPCIFSLLISRNQFHILSILPGDEQMATLRLELEQRDNELKRRRQEAKEHAEQMKVQYYVIKFGVVYSTSG